MEGTIQGQEEMICFICNQAETTSGTISVLLERGHHSLTIINIPARICPKCGEAYADETVTANLLHQAEQMAKAGTKVNTQEYVLDMH
jgi:YgiT-type zinc finger domain-containing protein